MIVGESAPVVLQVPVCCASQINSFLGDEAPFSRSVCAVSTCPMCVLVTVRLSLNFIIGCWGYTLDREDRVSGETSVAVLYSS
jgi:hypothetical protein